MIHILRIIEFGGLLQSSIKNLSVRQYPRLLATMTNPLDNVIDADIDNNGRFKYILIKVHNSPEGGKETSKHIVRGYASCEYHGDIYDMVRPGIEKNGLDCECVGGGRILHDAEKKAIQVFGYSQGFGKADHTISVGILEKKYTDYKITWSDEGY